MTKYTNLHLMYWINEVLNIDINTFDTVDDFQQYMYEIIVKNTEPLKQVLPEDLYEHLKVKIDNYLTKESVSDIYYKLKRDKSTNILTRLKNLL